LDELLVLGEHDFIERLGEHISRLLLGINGMDRDLSPVHMITEVVILDVDVLGARSIFWNCSNLQSSTGVFKDSTMDSRLGVCHLEAHGLQLFDKFHNWNGNSQRLKQTNELAFCRA
jgi:hypothetical protein